MQVANTLNNTIRILFNPRLENFKLFDFLVVKSDDIRYVAQVIEIYDDKFDASQNVAKIKLYYRITENNEVMPYDNFTPNKECEISKIKPEEIETFINQDKETFILGTNAKNSCALNIQYDFFNNNPIILADKVENGNALNINLAKKLSEKKHVVIIDTSGIIEIENAGRIKANKNFKLPLNYSTIDYVFEKCLYDASLEFQAIGGEIINEIKKFAKKQEHDFIPFNLLTRVLIQQHKATPYPELKLLLTRLKKYQMEEIFAKTKNEKEALFKSINKHPITIIDLSDIESYWQKAYIDYIITSIETEVYLLTRINDEQFDVDLINKIYNKKKNINFIPNVSYNYKKLPTVTQYCKNYILMPSLVQRTDFLDANFALSNLISDGCVIFGENTDNFLYMMRDYEIEIQEKRKNYRKIALTMVQQDSQQNLGEKGDYFANKNNQDTSDSARLIKELSEFEASQKMKIEAQEQVPSQPIEPIETQETFEEIEEINLEPEKQIKNQEAEEDLVFNKNSEEIFEDSENTEEEIADESDDEICDDEFFEESEKSEESDEELNQELNQNPNDKTEEEINKEIEKNNEADFREIISQETQEAQIDEFQEDSIIISDEEILEETQEDEIFQNNEDSSELLIIENEEKSTIEDDSLVNQEENVDFSDEELDFFQMAQESEEEYQEDEEGSTEEIDLNEIANNSIDDSFEEIINTKPQNENQAILLDKNTKIDSQILNQGSTKENLPIFKEESKTDENSTAYAVGNTIIHKKYGKGTIVKTIKYENRQLLQIEFAEAGKKLLDPKVAEIKLEQ